MKIVNSVALNNGGGKDFDCLRGVRGDAPKKKPNNLPQTLPQPVGFTGLFDIIFSL